MKQNMQYYLALFASQYQMSPNLKAWQQALMQPIDDLATCIQGFNGNYDIDCAVGIQLDVLGQLLGVSRHVPFQPSNGVSPILDDATYRVLLYATRANDNWDGKLSSIYSTMQGIFQTGSIILTDNQNMTASVTTTGTLSSIITDLINNGMIVPRPEGVQYNYQTGQVGPLFGFDENNVNVSGFDTGNWAAANSSVPAPLMLQAKSFSTATVPTLAFNSNVTKGNILVVAFSSISATAPTSITDTVGTVYTIASQSTGSSLNTIWIYTGTAAASGANTVTVNGYSGGTRSVSIAEFSNLSTTLVGTAQVVASATAQSSISVSITSAAPAVLVYANSTTTATTTFTTIGGVLASQANGAGAITLGYGVQVNAGALTVGATFNAAVANAPMVAIALRKP
jgi:hypothetical protein